MKYKIFFTDIALKNLKKYSEDDKKRILKKIEELPDDPFNMPNVKKLIDFYPSYRLRVGNYRILFEKKDNLQIIDIIDILHRSKAYKRRH